MFRLSFSCCLELTQSGEMNSSTAFDASRISDFTSLVKSLENSFRNSTISPVETDPLFMSSALKREIEFTLKECFDEWFESLPVDVCHYCVHVDTISILQDVFHLIDDLTDFWLNFCSYLFCHFLNVCVDIFWVTQAAERKFNKKLSSICWSKCDNTGGGTCAFGKRHKHVDILWTLNKWDTQ